MKKGFRNVITFIICMLIVVIVSGIGSIFTSNTVNGSWYNSIKPSITPPNYVFPIVWTILFFLIGLSLFFSWINAKGRNDKKKIIGVFTINFIFNILWSVLYFGMHNPILAFIDIILMVVSIVYMMIVTRRISRLASWLLLPYLLWVCFASLLNWLSI